MYILLPLFHIASRLPQGKRLPLTTVADLTSIFATQWASAEMSQKSCREVLFLGFASSS
jgi:hypothetical protein